MAEEKLTKLEIAKTLTGTENWKSFKATIIRWARANNVTNHLEPDITKRGQPSDPDELEKWEMKDAKIFLAISAKLSESIQESVSAIESIATMSVTSYVV